MSNPESSTTGHDAWTTSQVVDFLGFSRQAVNKRVHNRTLLGYRRGNANHYPVWQFDQDHASVRPEVTELLQAIGDDADPGDIAEWAETKLPECDSTPVDLLLNPATKAQALQLAHQFSYRSPLKADTTVDPGRDSAVLGLMFQRLRADSETRSDPRAAILLAAAELFAQHGPAKVSLRKVAEAAGVPYSLIYRFYRTKDQLLAATMEALVIYGARSLPRESDAYAAIANTIDSDSGMWARSVMWAVLDEVPPSRLFRQGLRAGGYRRQIDKLWTAPHPPVVRDEFDPRVVSSLVQLVIGTWSLLEPYLSVLVEDAPDTEAQRAEVIELLQLLIWSARPGHND